jgi:ribosomal protein L37AE/L43A
MRWVGPVLLVTIIVTGATVMSLRATRTDVDTTVSKIREDHTCGSCAHVFSLAIGEAAEMRRAVGDITCPKCGHRGAAKQSSLSAADMVNTLKPPTDETEPTEDDPTTPAKPGNAIPSMNREKVP